MPYVYDPNLDKENQEQQGQVQISGASPTSDPEGGNDKNQTHGLQTGSGYQNLDAYINTNDPQKFGQEVVGKVSADVDLAKQNQQQASDEFKQKVAGANALPTSDQYNKAIADPINANKDEFQNWENQTYSGPKSLAESSDSWNKYWSGTEKADNSTKLLGSEPGRFALLDSYYGRPSYSFGEKSLDNLLIQHAGIGQKTKDLQGQAAQLKSNGELQANALQDVASQRAGEIDQSRLGVRNAVGIDAQGNPLADRSGALGQKYNQVDQELKDANAARQADIAAAKGEVGSARFSNDLLSKFGLSAGENAYGLDLNNYFHGGGDLDRDQTMTPEERAYITALSQLSGAKDDYATGAPKAVTDPYSFDTAQFRNDQGNTKAALAKEWEATPVNIDYRDRGGQLQTMTLAQAREGVASIQRDAANGIDAYPNANREFMARAVPAIAAAEAALSAKYQTGRTIQDSGNPNRPRIGPQIRPRI